LSLARTAKRRDENEKTIVNDLRKVGAKVERLDKPDLIVRFAGRVYLMEITNPDNKYRKRDAAQREFLETFLIPEIRNSEEALRLIGAL
jgi:hypothetical protein